MTLPDVAAYSAKLIKQGYQVATKSMDPFLDLDDHTHDADILGLVTAGEITITVNGEVRRYGIGDEFTMASGRPHSEVVGPEGVTFIVGRRGMDNEVGS